MLIAESRKSSRLSAVNCLEEVRVSIPQRQCRQCPPRFLPRRCHTVTTELATGESDLHLTRPRISQALVTGRERSAAARKKRESVKLLTKVIASVSGWKIKRSVAPETEIAIRKLIAHLAPAVRVSGTASVQTSSQEESIALVRVLVLVIPSRRGSSASAKSAISKGAWTS